MNSSSLIVRSASRSIVWARLIHRRSWPEKAELRTEVFDYIEAFYNRQRRHRSLGFLSPAQFETITHHHQLEELQPA